jgi:hypothetical protein
MDLNIVIVSSFLIGMSLVLVGVVFAGFETYKGYEIIAYEVKVHE